MYGASLVCMCTAIYLKLQNRIFTFLLGLATQSTGSGIVIEPMLAFSVVSELVLSVLCTSVVSISHLQISMHQLKQCLAARCGIPPWYPYLYL